MIRAINFIIIIRLQLIIGAFDSSTKRAQHTDRMYANRIENNRQTGLLKCFDLDDKHRFSDFFIGATEHNSCVDS